MVSVMLICTAAVAPERACMHNFEHVQFWGPQLYLVYISPLVMVLFCRWVAWKYAVQPCADWPRDAAWSCTGSSRAHAAKGACNEAMDEAGQHSSVSCHAWHGTACPCTVLKRLAICPALVRRESPLQAPRAERLIPSEGLARLGRTAQLLCVAGCRCERPTLSA